MVERAVQEDRSVVVVIEDEFSRAPLRRRRALTATWMASLAEGEPVELPVSGAELVAEVRTGER